MSPLPREIVAGIVAGAVALPFAVYFSVVVVGTMLGGVGASLAGKPGALLGSFGGAILSCAALVFLSFALGRLVARWSR